MKYVFYVKSKRGCISDQDALTVATAGHEGNINVPQGRESQTNGYENGEGDCLRYNNFPQTVNTELLI